MEETRDPLEIKVYFVRNILKHLFQMYLAELMILLII